MAAGVGLAEVAEGDPVGGVVVVGAVFGEHARVAVGAVGGAEEGFAEPVARGPVAGVVGLADVVDVPAGVLRVVEEPVEPVGGDSAAPHLVQAHSSQSADS